jgi:6-phospho-3-hexuloisomerase
LTATIGEYLRSDLEELGQLLLAVDPSAAEQLASAILAAERVYLAGLGRSGLVMRMLALRLMQLGLQTYVVGDPTTPAIGERDLLVVGSASGETQGALLAARQALVAGAKVAAVTAAAASTLASLADLVLVIPGATPKSVGRPACSALPLASVLEQAFLVVADCVVARLAQRTGTTDGQMMARHANIE